MVVTDSTPTIRRGFFRKRPVVIEALLFDGTNVDECLAFIGAPREEGEDAEDFDTIDIDTLEGTMETRQGDWIIKGVQGEFYPVKPDIFEATYEPA